MKGRAGALLTVAGKAIIWLTVFVMSPFVSLLWRIRRKLADATAVQLTRQPDALADGLRKLAGMNVKVPGEGSIHAFWVLMVVMLAVLIGVAVFFRRRGWL